MTDPRNILPSRKNPINHCLPFELLVEIFSYFLALPSNDHYDAQYNPYRTNLRTVCTHWNNVILDYPLFWSKFYLDFPKHRPSPSTLQTWIKRAARVPLEIYINNIHSEYWYPENQIWEVLTPLVSCIAQWKKLMININPTIPIHSRLLQNIDFSSAHLLEEVVFHDLECHLRPWINDNNAILVDALGAAPNLHTLKFGPGFHPETLNKLSRPTTNLPIHPTCNNLPFRHITNLIVDSFLPTPIVLDLVRSYPTPPTPSTPGRLSVRIGGSEEYLLPDPNRPTTPPQTSSLNIHILELSLTSLDGHQDIFPSLSLPNLQVLIVHFESSSHRIPFTSLLKFVSDCVSLKGPAGGGRGSHSGAEGVVSPPPRSLQIFKVTGLTGLDILSQGQPVHLQSLRNIPILEIQVTTLPSVTVYSLLFSTFLSEPRHLWQPLGDSCSELGVIRGNSHSGLTRLSPFRVCSKPSSDRPLLTWSLGWTDSKSFSECQKSLPRDILGGINTRLLC